MNTKEFDYRRLRVRADLIRKMDAIKSKDESLTAFLNMAVASFLSTRKAAITTAQVEQRPQ